MGKPSSPFSPAAAAFFTNSGFVTALRFLLYSGMKRFLFYPTVLLLCMLTHGARAEADPFAYDRSAALGVKSLSTLQQGAATLTDLEFNSEGVTLKAFVVSPAMERESCAGILYVHWLGDPETSNRTQFLPEALELAERGVVSVLLEAPWSNPNWYRERIPEQDLANSVRQVIAQRRAMDLLLSQPGVAPARVAVVAHDFGAMYAMLAEAAERRAKTYLFMAPTPHFVDWFLFARQPARLEEYKAGLAAIDPVRFVGRLSPAPILFQFASRDYYVSADEAAEFAAAVKGPREVRTYDTEHHLRVPQARADRLAWLLRELGLGGVAE